MGLNLPQHMTGTASDVQRVVNQLNDSSERHAMASGTGMERTATVSSTDAQWTYPKVYDPTRNEFNPNRKFNLDKDDMIRKRLFDWCDAYYRDNELVGAIIDVYSTYPIKDMHMECKDKEIERYYEDLFFDDLDYESLLKDVGKEYWLKSNVFSVADWDDELKVWTDEKIIDPRLMKIEHIPFSGNNNYYFEPSTDFKNKATSSKPEGLQFKKQWPDVYKHIMLGDDIPVSQDRLIHLARRSNAEDAWGTPLVMRCMRTLKLESRLNDAMQSMAEREYAPMTMFKIGTKLGDNIPWIPSEGQLQEFREALNTALVSDFRAIITHFAVDVEEVLPVRNMSAWADDYDMYDERIFMAFGLTSDIFKAQNAQPYASSSLRLDLCAQYLSTAQKVLKTFYQKRAKTVAKANGHYDFKEIDGKRETLYHIVKEWDPDIKDFHYKKEPKLLIPDLVMQNISFRNQDTEREFLLELKSAGMPIAANDILQTVDVEFNESMEQENKENISSEIHTAKMHKAIMDECIREGYPVPPATVDYYRSSGIFPDEYRKKIPAADIEPYSETSIESPADPEMDAAPQQGGGATFVGDVDNPADGGSRPQASDDYEPAD